MKEKQEYLKSFLNNKASILNFYVPQITKDKNNFGYQKIYEYINEVDMVFHKMPDCQIPINDFFNTLLLLKEDPKLKEFLEKYNYEDTFLKYYQKNVEFMNNKIQNLNVDNLFVEFLINNNLLKDMDIQNVTMYYLKLLLMRKRLITFDTFQKLIILYIKNAYNLDAEIEKFSHDLREPFNEKVKINYESLLSFYYTSSYQFILELFHEVRHTNQYQEIFILKKNDDNTLKMIKDSILCSLSSTYAKDNEYMLSFENDANIFAMQNLLKMFQNMGFNFKNNQNPYTRWLDANLKNYSDKKRRYQKESAMLDDIFAIEILNHKEFLEIYPQLQEEYEIVSDMLIAKKRK